MIRIHNKSTYNRVYNSFSRDFIDTFCQNRLSGFDTRQSLEAAKIAIQMRASLEIVRNSPNKLVIIQAYKNMKQDMRLIHKAIHYYQGMKKD